MRRSRKAINQMNVTPMVDVMLVLLVIFMVTAPLINPGQIELPPVGQKLEVPVAPLEITLKTDQTLTLQDQATAAPAVRLSRSELLARVLDIKSRRPDQPVVIAADRTSKYEDVLAILDLLQRNGVRKVGLLARPASTP
jgi:biopolymer transport protein TolR